MNIEKLNKIGVVGTRVFLGLIFFTAGMSKLYANHKFPGLIGPVWLEESLAEHGLAMYARFIAWSQVVAGFLLLSQRFASLGATLTFPIILNIFMVTVSLEWKGTPYVNAVFLLMNAYLLLYDYHKFKHILSNKTTVVRSIPIQRNSKKADWVWAFCFALIIASVFISKIHLLTGWLLCGTALLTLVWNQLRKKSENNFLSEGT